MYYYSKQARVFGYLLFFLEQKHRHRHGPTVDGPQESGHAHNRRTGDMQTFS